jgi:hypothetical protein
VIVDTETLDLLLTKIAEIWKRPLDDYELGVWRRALQPTVGPAVDPDLAAEALMVLKNRPEFEFSRPDVVAFKSAYDRIHESTLPPAPDPEDKLATAETVTEVLQKTRADLAAAAIPKPDPEPSGQLL